MILRPVDVLTLAYFGAGTVLVCVGHKHVSRWYEVPLSFGLASLVIVVLAVVHGRRPGDSRIAFLRLTYPLLAMAYIYVLAGRSALAIHGRYLDTEVNSFELSVFGDHPNLVLDRLATQPLTELMMAGYVLYYAFFLVPPLILLAQRRRHELERYVFTLTFVLYVCFVGFSLVPLVGPALSLSDSFETRELSGYLATGVQHFIASFGDPPGACWPSAHVAGAWAALLSIRQAFGTSALWATLSVHRLHHHCGGVLPVPLRLRRPRRPRRDRGLLSGRRAAVLPHRTWCRVHDVARRHSHSCWSSSSPPEPPLSHPGLQRHHSGAIMVPWT